MCMSRGTKPSLDSDLSSISFLLDPNIHTAGTSAFFFFFQYLFIYLFGCTVSQLWPVGSLVAARRLLSCGSPAPQLQNVGSLVAAPGLLSCSSPAPQLWHSISQLWHACGIQFPDQGLNPGHPHWECGVLSTAPPGKSQNISFLSSCSLREFYSLTKSPL